MTTNEEGFQSHPSKNVDKGTILDFLFLILFCYKDNKCSHFSYEF